MPKTIIEPFRIKSVEPIRMTTRKEREALLQEAGYNPFLIKAENVLIDLLTDSGTGAMSAQQWAGIQLGDESYAGSSSFYHFERVVRDLTGFRYIIPTHQGRAAERILFQIIGGKNHIIPNNSHFDTTRANCEASGAEARDLPCREFHEIDAYHPFKGNMDLERLESFLAIQGQRVPIVMVTLTNNTGGGQPVSLENLKKTSEICKKYNKPLFLDCCRFAENAYFIKIREKNQQNRSVEGIAKEIFRLADGATMSGKKDGLVNTGGFLAMNHDSWAEQARQLLILTEGFPTYGGLAGRDLEAYAFGLREVLDENYLKYRIRTAEYLGEKLLAAGIPIMNPPGGHAVYLDGLRFMDHIPRVQFPAQVLSCALYLEGGIRGVEIGSVMFGKENTPYQGHELVRLALPRRTYTQSHVDYVIEIIISVYQNRKNFNGLRFTYQAPRLRHFTARFSCMNE